MLGGWFGGALRVHVFLAVWADPDGSSPAPGPGNSHSGYSYTVLNTIQIPGVVVLPMCNINTFFNNSMIIGHDRQFSHDIGLSAEGDVNVVDMPINFVTV